MTIESIEWYKMEDEISAPHRRIKIASYMRRTNDIIITDTYKDRQVTLHPTDAHLSFPEILFSDEGNYTCILNTDLDYNVLIEVKGWH